jgi:hypothetical protein
LRPLHCLHTASPSSPPAYKSRATLPHHPAPLPSPPPSPEPHCRRSATRRRNSAARSPSPPLLSPFQAPR